MFSYLTSETTELDAGFLEYLTAEFTKRAAANSSDAIKFAMQEILMSNSFAQRSPTEGVCYDYAPGVDPTGQPPCKVARILQNHCAKCHSGAGGAGGLDLMSWKAMADGQLGFPHLQGGNAVARPETFVRIADRVSTADQQKRMPLNSGMPTAMRQELYRWANKMAEKK